MDRLEEEKKTIDVRVENQRYAFVARKKDHYDQVETELNTLNQFLASQVEAARKHAIDLFEIKF